MARDFTAASSQYLKHSVAIVSHPFTVSGWFYANDADNAYSLWSMGDEGGANTYGLQLEGSAAGDKVNFWAYATQSDYKQAYTTSGFSAVTWHHACGVLDSSRNLAVYLDGGNKGTNTPTTGVPSSLDNTVIGALVYVNPSPAQCFDGYLAEVACWSAVLTDAEVAILAAGYSPLFVRPQSLVAYWPLIGRTSPEIDIVGGYNMTLTNAPTVAAQPRNIYPSNPQVGLTIPAASAASPYMTTSPGLWGPL